MSYGRKGGQEQTGRGFVARVRKLGFIPSVMGSHWRVSSKEQHDLVSLLESYRDAQYH